MLTGTSMASGGTTVSSSYTYTDDRLTEVSHNSPNSGSVDYTFSYNTLGWNTGTSVGAQSLITRSLEENTGRLNSVTYGNGQTLSYTYDAYDRVIKVSQGATDLYAYEYDNSGNVGYVKDYLQNAEYRYEYDSLNRLGMITKKDSAGTCTTTYSYNNVDSVSSFKEKIYGTDYETAYTYDDDGKADTSAFGTYSIDNAYNATLGTLTGTSIKNGANTIYSTSIGYEAGDGSTSVNSGRVSSITNGAETLSYTYDDRGYITRIQKDANNYSEYRYDAFGQLIRENYKWGGTSYTVLYTYDVGGNILSKGQYAFVAGDGAVGAAIDTVAYTYDATWKDKLASYDGVGITYDNIGNPTDDGTWEYTWTQGRKLQQMTDGATTASFKYNDDGIRTEKTVNGTTIKYNVVGGNVTWEKTGASNPIYFLYDASGSLWGLKYTDGNLYFYVYNAQGDIIKIVNSSGTVVVEYGYDAWGNLLFTSGSMAGTLGADNPFRYRGYYYDDETELYYLSSRYYSPEWGRFINADGVISGIGAIQGYNLFTYCFNNPINMADEEGQWPSWATKILIGVGAIVLGAAITVATGGAGAAFIPALVAGTQAALTSAAIGAVVGAGASAVSHRVSTGSWKGSGEAALNGAVNGAVDGFMTGGIMAGASQALSGGFKVAANLGAKTGRNGGINLAKNVKVLSPNHVKFHEAGGTLLKIGTKASNIRIDVGVKSLFHMNVQFGTNIHIPIGILGSGLYGGLR